MRKLLFGLVSCLLLTQVASANHVFILKDVTKDKAIVQEGNINEPFSPCSTFKIALALMGYESGFLTGLETPLIKYVPEKHWVVTEMHKQDMTPKKWMKYSAVWYSQEMTTTLGMDTFKGYVNRLGYGNKDVTGDPHKKNGLTHAWLGTSLKITPQQQLDFLTQLMQQKLPFKPEAQKMTRELMAQEDDINGWKVFGKTGSGYEKNPDGTKNDKLMHGWFVGWLEKGGQRLVFVYHKSNVSTEGGAFGGPVAKQEVIEKMRKLLPSNA